MSRNLFIGTMFAAVAAIAWLGGCVGQQTPTNPSQGSITISAPPNLKNGGQTGQLTAQETLANGSKLDVTSVAVWSSSNPNVATVSATGLVTLIANGVTNITARLSSGLYGVLTLPVMVVTVAGRVVEPGGLGLPQAQITIIGGSKDGVVTLTDQDGNYSVPGAVGAQQVRAQKDGYVTATVSVGPNLAVNFTLNPTTPYADLHGSWNLTFSASSSCQLPDEAMTRRYTAAIDQDNARLTIRLSDAQFGSVRSSPENWIFGRVAGNNVTLTLAKTGDDGCFYYGACLVELLADGTYLTLDGSAAGSLNGSVLATMLAGAINLIKATGGPPIATCAAADHHLTFTR
jgi:Big-like domain-containing protein/carboxypeptidase family protein